MKSAFLLLIAAISLFAQEPVHPRHTRPGPPSELVKQGESQFVQSCGFCHGRTAMGGSGGPNLMRSAVVRHDKDGDLIGAVIRDGRPGKGMPPIPLDASQISAVVAFLHARLAAGDRRSAGRPRHDYAAKLLLTGDAKQGETFFNGAGGCSGCHSPQGDLAGIAKKYEPVNLQARFLYPPGPAPKILVTLKSGTQVAGTLALLTNFDVALRDAAGWYHSWPRRDVKIAVNDPLARHRALLSQYTDADMHNLLAYLETLQ